MVYKLKRVPHTRGDGPHPFIVASAIEASSPHTWGWTCVLCRRVCSSAEFPTHVGMDLQLARSGQDQGRVPHTRGDGPTATRPPTSRLRSSPHTWGWTAESMADVAVAQEFPTHVGMDLDGCGARMRAYRVPHTRGDGPGSGCGHWILRSSSPHTWGWTFLVQVQISGF